MLSVDGCVSSGAATVGAAKACGLVMLSRLGRY